MSTTTIRLPEDLKARVAAAAERAGTTAHSLIRRTPSQSDYRQTRIRKHEGVGHWTQRPWLRSFVPLHRADRHGLRARNTQSAEGWLCQNVIPLKAPVG